MGEVPQRTLARIRATSASDLIAICSSIRSTIRTTVAPESSERSGRGSRGSGWPSWSAPIFPVRPKAERSSRSPPPTEDRPDTRGSARRGRTSPWPPHAPLRGAGRRGREVPSAPRTNAIGRSVGAKRTPRSTGRNRDRRHDARELVAAQPLEQVVAARSVLFGSDCDRGNHEREPSLARLPHRA